MMKIVSNIPEDFDMTKNEFRSNPIAAYLVRHIEDRLAYAYRKAANDDDALVITNFDFDEDSGIVTYMQLVFNVRSWGEDVLSDKNCLKTFEEVCQRELNCARIHLTHHPNNGFGLAVYETDKMRDMMALLEAFESIGCDISTTFKLVDKKQRVRGEKARIGFFGRAREYEVYVRTDDESQEPHFHVRDIYTEADTAICLQSNRYCKHPNTEPHIFRYDFLELLYSFLSEPCRSPRYVDNYEFAVIMWNINNHSDCSYQKGEDGYSIIPDYRTIK